MSIPTREWQYADHSWKAGDHPSWCARCGLDRAGHQQRLVRKQTEERQVNPQFDPHQADGMVR